ncbi:DUF4147 domain-containing protein [Candidatus Parcubacteria bacterium]|nr:DUF4147 domain-containing protein [Candidatus Parcubacteria bacterium]
MIIKNKEKIATSELRRKALAMVEAGIERVLPSTLLDSFARYDPVGKVLTVKNDAYNLSNKRLFVVGGGKAAGLMAEKLEEIIGPENIVAGAVNCKSSNYNTKKIKITAASHPLPDERGIKGAKEIMELKARHNIGKDDLVVCLLSGGGSALMSCPVEEISLEDMQKITKLLLASGSEIEEINAVRKHLSRIKGGKLGSFFAPATVVSLIISDVVGNKIDVIASGPTFPGSTSFSDAYNVLEKYDLLGKAPDAVVEFLKKAKPTEETPKTLVNCHNYIIGDNRLALESIADKARGLGFNPFIVTAEQTGDPTLVAQQRAKEILEEKYAGHNVILIGGETTPKLPDNPGQGGRNQHYAAVSLDAMKEYGGDWVVCALATDGSDFLPNVAGAIIDNKTLVGREIDTEEYLKRYDSNALFAKTGRSLIETGDTGTNVSDVIIYVLNK